MTSADRTPVQGKARSSSAGWVHFSVAAAILLLTTVGWGWAVTNLKWALRKEPVPWPAGVTVSSDCRLTSFPDRVGPYVLAADGEFGKAADGQPDGDVILDSDTLELLHINTALDRARRDQRQSNWYASRIYRDTRVEVGPYRYWRLEIYYYTGGLDKVPHVPERCAQAGGARLAGGKTMSFAVTDQAEPWDKSVAFRKTCYEMTSGDSFLSDSKKFVQYYTFSLNGSPEASWEKVRALLTLPTQRYCYFAKVQFGPAGDVAEFDEADGPAQEFIRVFMPTALAALPMPKDISALAATASPKP